MSDKVYAGQGKEIAGKFGPFIALTLFEKDVQALVDHAKATGKPVRININRRKEPSPKGYTHYGVIDQWTPPERQEHPNYDQPEQRAPAGTHPDEDTSGMADGDDIPF